MNVFFAEKLKELRTERKVSQEKLAQYLNVTFQAVSKWENGNAYPDITLLPEIARYFGVSVDELLCVERIDEDRLYKEYEEKADELYRNGKIPCSTGRAEKTFRISVCIVPIPLKPNLRKNSVSGDENHIPECSHYPEF